MGFVERTTISIGGEEKEWILNLATHVRFQEKTGLLVDDILNGTIDQKDAFRAIGTLVWAGLVKNEPDLSIDDVLEQLPFYPLEEYAELVIAIVASMPKKTKVEEGAEGRPLESESLESRSETNGETSGPSGDSISDSQNPSSGN